MNETDKEDLQAGCGGCVSCTLVILFFLALFLGVTVEGTHYMLNCSCDRGLEVIEERVDEGDSSLPDREDAERDSSEDAGGR
jgi:hypothetical protein